MADPVVRLSPSGPPVEIPAGGVESFNGRTGAVLPQAGDYTSAQVSDASTVGGPTVLASLNALDVDIAAIQAFLATLPTSEIGAFAARPVSANEGSQYFATDGVIGHWVREGSLWRPMIAGVLGFEVPSLADFNADWTTYNAGGISVAAANGGLLMTGVTDAVIHNRGWALPVPDTGDVSIEVCIQDMGEGLGGANRLSIWGCGMRRSATQESFVLSTVKNDDFGGTFGFIDLSGWTNDNTRATFVQPRFAGNGNGTGGPIFIRARRTAGQFISEVSCDRQTWIEVSNVAATFAADQVIIATDVFNGPAVPQFMLLSLLVEGA